MNDITVLVPTSPIKSHPSTAIIQKAIASVQKHLPDAEIRIMIDGIRDEQKEYLERYVDYIGRLATEDFFCQDNIRLFPFVSHQHQVAMTRHVLKSVTTPLIMLLEHDTFFLDGLPIDFAGIARVIKAGHANMVQFHCQWEPWIIPEHEHLMLDKERKYIDGVPMVRTWQFSARPHVASADFYRGMLSSWFTLNARTFIEDRMVDVLAGARMAIGNDAWEDWKLFYYAPEGTIRRTWTDDGRASDPKFPITY